MTPNPHALIRSALEAMQRAAQRRGLRISALMRLPQPACHARHGE